MSFQAWCWVLARLAAESNPPEANAQLVWLELAQDADEQGFSQASLAQLVEQTRLTRDSVIAALDALLAAGYVSRTERGRSGGWRYDLGLPEQLADAAPPAAAGPPHQEPASVSEAPPAAPLTARAEANPVEPVGLTPTDPVEPVGQAHALARPSAPRAAVPAADDPVWDRPLSREKLGLPHVEKADPFYNAVCEALTSPAGRRRFVLRLVAANDLATRTERKFFWEQLGPLALQAQAEADAAQQAADGAGQVSPARRQRRQRERAALEWLAAQIAARHGCRCQGWAANGDAEFAPAGPPPAGVRPGTAGWEAFTRGVRAATAEWCELMAQADTPPAT